jgi:hypothetical protein
MVARKPKPFAQSQSSPHGGEIARTEHQTLRTESKTPRTNRKMPRTKSKSSARNLGQVLGSEKRTHGGKDRPYGTQFTRMGVI